MGNRRRQGKRGRGGEKRGEEKRREEKRREEKRREEKRREEKRREEKRRKGALLQRRGGFSGLISLSSIPKAGPVRTVLTPSSRKR
ncbi:MULTISPECIES: hypothetical protein [unclassified Paenibacillus]|uniref:hypothetical protein n=1 Tax=unclassified Paenibacillus TaxID=185978 RepID=UPI00135645FD|nr:MULTISPECIES: hypothetical protein [unclassified Paenibacillus]